MKWVHPNLIIGNKATGKYYFRRPEIEREISIEIKKGNHVLVAAPRRVGKTSVMEYLKSNCDENWMCVMENIQSISSENELYKRMYELILSCLNTNKQLWNKLGDKFREINLEEVGMEGKLKFGDKKQLDYKAEIDNLIPQLPKEIKLVIFLDELPEVLHQLNKANKKAEANSLLKNLRRWRQGEEFNLLCLVVTGSIGLHHIVADITGRVTDNNDYGRVSFKPFNYKQAFDFIDFVTDSATVKYSADLKLYLLDKIQYKIPYFINLILTEVDKKAFTLNDVNITNDSIDDAFEKVILENENFKDWKKRLFEYFEISNAKFMNDILIEIAHLGVMNKRKIYDLSRKRNKVDSYMELVKILVNDGYVVEQEHGYVFLSPFLATFWKNDNPIFDE